MPPSTTSWAPVMNDASSEARKSAAFASSSASAEATHRDVHHAAGAARRDRRAAPRAAGSGSVRGTASSPGCPGARTRPRSRASSRARRPCSRCTRSARWPRPSSATNDATLTMLPPPDASIAGIPAWQPSHTPLRLIVHDLFPRRLGRVEHAAVVGGEDAGVVVEHVQAAVRVGRALAPSPRSRPTATRRRARTWRRRPRRAPRRRSRCPRRRRRRSRRRARLRSRTARPRRGPCRCPRR